LASLLLQKNPYTVASVLLLLLVRDVPGMPAVASVPSIAITLLLLVCDVAGMFALVGVPSVANSI
jgi:hypothetical protein